MDFRFITALASQSWLSSRWRLLAALAIPPVLAGVALLAIGLLNPLPSPPNPPPAQEADAISVPPASGLLVEVTGAVAHPGLYRVAKGERVSAAIAAAGGYASGADPDRLPNMAARLKDGEQIKVPFRPTSTSTRTTTPRTASGAAGGARAVSLNQATAEQLAAIPGFTPDLAAAAIRYRTEYGGFVTSRELVDVLNMSETDYLRARRYLTV
jgi:competence protein ComEA